MTQTETLRLALEALRVTWYHVGTFAPTDEAIELYDEATAAIKAALEAKDEPVAWMWMPTGEVTTNPDRADGMWEPLFLASPQRTWEGLTDEDLFSIYNQTHWNVNEDWNYERAIEAKLKEKNGYA